MDELLEKRKSLYGFEIREPDKRRSGPAYDIKQLWQRSHEIICLALQGHNQKSIAEILNVHQVTVSNTLNSELGQKKLSSMRESRDEEFIEVSREVSKLSEKALKVYDEIFDNDTVSYSLKKNVADTVLMDLGGHRSPTKIDTRTLNVSATAEEIIEFKRRGVAAAKESGMLVEITPKELNETQATAE